MRGKPDLKPRTKLRAAREARGWSRPELAAQVQRQEDGLRTGEEIRLDPKLVEKWESDEVSPRLFYQARVCLLFESGPEDLDFEPSARLELEVRRLGSRIERHTEAPGGSAPSAEADAWSGAGHASLAPPPGGQSVVASPGPYGPSGDAGRIGPAGPADVKLQDDPTAVTVSPGLHDAVALAAFLRSMTERLDVLLGRTPVLLACQEANAAALVRDPPGALREAAVAEAAWMPGHPRPFGTWAHTRIAAGIAHLASVDGASEQIGPVLELPYEYRVATLMEHIATVDRLLQQRRFHGTREATRLRDRIAEFTHGVEAAT